ncbi:EAL domain-containing protein [Rhodoferax sp.]|uniref:EAL domain-containing protein n=1 Tax=Rhodoferax sp. TaxID=50421 RepID=UPI00277AE60A|nr:EAL domain-containing protein [Rhodoferax sp.]
MSTETTMPQPGKAPSDRVIQFLGATVLYTLIGVASHFLLRQHEVVDLWRPASGLALAMVLLGGFRLGWAVFVGALLEAMLTHGVSTTALALSLGSVAGPLSGAWLLRRQSGLEPGLGHLRSYLWVVARGGAFGALVAALVGAGTLYLLSVAPMDTLPRLAMRWWMGDMLGIALLTPLLLVWWGVKRVWRSREQMAESLIVVGLTFLAGQTVFLDLFTDAQHQAPIGYWMFLFVGWAALRLERRGITVVLMMIALQSLIGAFMGHGFLAEDLRATHLAVFWGYMMVLSMAGLGLSDFAARRRRESVALTKQTMQLRDRALEKVQEGVALANAERRLTYVNEAFEQLTGYSRAELIGKSCSVLQGPKTDGQVIQDIRDCLSTLRPFNGELLNYRKDGSTFWNAVSITPILDTDGKLIEFFGVQRDVTAARDAALALRKSQEQMELVLKGSNDGIWDWNVVDDMIERSRRWYEMLGYDPQVFPHFRSSWAHIVHPDDVARINAEMDQLLAGQSVRYEMNLRLRHKQGHYLSMLSRGYILRDQSGKAMRVAGTTTNLTDQREKEAKLSLAAAVFLQSREGITITDAKLNIIMVNKAFTDITGYCEAEVLGENPRIQSSGRHDKAFYQSMWAAINERNRWEGEIWNRRKDGAIYCQWLAISALRDAAGQVTHYIGNFTDLSDAKAAESRILWLSHFDALTGLPNTTLLRDRTAHAISMVQRRSEPLTMMLLGIDHFKAVNDAMGHKFGDQVLIDVARRLSASVREQDTVARLAGKEFMLILPGTAPEGAAHLSRELLCKLSQPYQVGAEEVTLTASIGLASYPANGGDFDHLFKSAEIAMHRAQANGRDTFQFYSDELYQQVLARDHMVKALRNAATLDQLQLVYQPLVDLQNGQISGLEALLRWHHPELGQVPPAQFIPLAEESGLIKSIGEWVLQRACRDIRVWLDKGINVPHVAVNVSTLQFRDADLIDHVKAALATYRVDSALLCLEVTESALMDNVLRSEALLHQLKALGIKLSLDDFGTGYSSLSYLKRFPFDKVKIDQSFVRDITTSQSDTVIVRVIVSMAHGLGLRVIAEGVETEAQCEVMRTSVCDEIQGYFFSRPISAQAIEELMAEGRQLPAHLLRLQKPQRALLLVDDEPNIVAALKRLFRRDGHTIHTANSGQEGLAILAKHKVDVIVSDQRMPGMTGVEFLRAAKALYPDTMRIVLSGYTELQSVTDAINEGAVYRFLTKPWDDEQLRDHIKKAFEYKELQEANQQLDIQIRSTNQELVAANRQLGAVLTQTQHQMERDNTGLDVVREALQHVPLPMLGVGNDGLIAFANTAAEHLLGGTVSLLGEELVVAAPVIADWLTATDENACSELSIGGVRYELTWNTMGASSRSRGKLLTLIRTGLTT